jgi:short-subunit dehydrogenase
MKLEGTRVLLTGASGGIGAAVAERLAAKGGSIALFDRNAGDLQALREHLQEAHPGSRFHAFGVDLLDRQSREAGVAAAMARLGGIDLLVNCAGLMSFRPFADEDPAALEKVIQLNLLVPTLLVRQVLPTMLERGSGQIVNVGSTFGSIGFAWFAAYSASKFGLRGLSEALRRELEGTGVRVTYVAPRAVKTTLNTGAVYRMADATRMSMDEPGRVASRIVASIEQDAKDVYIGFPETFFARLNSLLPRLVDAGLRKQNQLMAPFARELQEPHQSAAGGRRSSRIA